MNSILKNVQDFWSKLALNQRISLVAALLLVLGVVIFLYNWASEPKMNFLLGGIGQSDMAEIAAKLDEKGIDYKTGGSMGAGSIYINADKDMTARIRLDLFGQGLPSGDSVGFEIFDQNNFGISDFAQRTNLVRAIQGELARTISQIKGIKSARVQAVVPENKLLITDPSSRAKASVFIDTGNGRITESQVNSIRSLVSNAIEGVAVEDVAVIDNHGNNLTESLGESSMGGQNALKVQENIEKYYSRKIVAMLTPIVGPGNVVAEVSVEIDTTAQTFLEEKFDPDVQVVRSQTTDEDKLNTTEGKSQEGGVGAAANIPAAADAGGNEPTIVSQTDETRKTKNTQYEINRSLREQVQNPGSVKSKRATVYLNKRQEEGAQARTAEELEDFRITVANALGVDLSIADGNLDQIENLVAVKEIAFSQPAGNVSGQTTESFVIKYGDLVKKFIAGAIILGILFYMMKVLKGFKPQANDVEILSDLDSNNIAPNQLDTNLTPELLNDLIQEKPENVSTALKSWVQDNPNN